MFPGRSLNASRCRLVVAGQLPAVLDGVPLPLLAEEVVQFAALLQLLVLLGQLQLLLLGCGTQSHVHRVRRRLGSSEPSVNTISVSKTRLNFAVANILTQIWTNCAILNPSTLLTDSYLYVEITLCCRTALFI